MVKGLFTAYSGMINEEHRMEVLTNNLANSATIGFKKEGSTSQTFQELLSYKIKDLSEATDRPIGYMVPGVKIGENYTDYSQGSLRATENTFDLALSGDGFFNVEFTNKVGEEAIKYTRDGTFSVNAQGYLVTQDGDYVLARTAAGGTQRIQIDPNQEAAVDQLGNISQGGVTVAQLALTDFEDYDYLEHYGENYFQPVEGAEMLNAGAKVISGYLEVSNVNVVKEMVEMISVTRAYETNQKIIQAYDDTLNIAVNQIGKV